MYSIGAASNMLLYSYLYIYSTSADKICITCAHILNITAKNALAGTGMSIYGYYPCV